MSADEGIAQVVQPGYLPDPDPLPPLTIPDACSRCGNSHHELEVFQFNNPPDKRTTHYAICPVTQQPIIVFRG